jgi:hypothetical protein
MRTRAFGVLAVLGLAIGLAGTASANSIQYVWTATSGGGVGVGTSTLTGVAVSDTATLQIRVTATAAGITGVFASAMESAVLSAVSWSAPCPGGAPGNLAASLCGGIGTSPAATFLSALGGAVVTPPIYNWAATTLGTPITGGTFTLAEITFHAAAPGTTGTFIHKTGVDGINDGSGSFDSNPAVTDAVVTVVPEPGTFALMALGLGALAFAGRRR